jgi:tape measure domain-containing protein
MATYRIDFSTNASRVAQEIDKVNKALTEAVRTSKPVEIRLDDTKLSQQLNTTFKKLDKEIAKYEKELRKIQIGTPEFGAKSSQIGQLEGQRQRAAMEGQAMRLRSQAGAFPQESFAGLSREIQAAKISASMIQPNTEAWTNLQREIARLNLDLKKADQLAENIQLTEQLGALSPQSLNALETKLTILRNRAREISPDTAEWKKVNQEIQKTEQAIEKQTRRPLTQGQRLGAAGGAFLYGGGLGGGVGSAVGGIAGGLAGGVPGAFTGAAVGQAVDNMTAMAFAMTEQANAVRRLRLGLASASTGLEDFAQANQTVSDISDRLLIPLGDTYRQFTRLRASTVALGLDTKTTGEVFEGIAVSVLKTGGSMEDVDGAMRAVSQVFSKGKVTAEELRGQLGERLPGAVVKFANANKIALQDLDKAFESGQVSVDQFVTFAKSLLNESSGYSDELAKRQEYASARYAKAVEKMQLAVGKAVGPMLNSFQSFAAQAINEILALMGKLEEFASFLENRFSGGGKGAGSTFLGEGAQNIADRLIGGDIALKDIDDRTNFFKTKIEEAQNQLSTIQAGRYKDNRNIFEQMFGGPGEESLRKGLPNQIASFKKQLEEIQRARDIAEKKMKGGGGGGKPSAVDENAQKAAQKYLDAIDKREQGLADARISYEQEIASIRENAVKQAEILEQRYQDRRLQDERELGRVRRELAAAVQEEGLLSRSIAGEDPELIDQERRIGEAIRQYTEDKISREETAQDRQIAQSRELEDFKQKNADAINKANERYAKAIGKIQQEYAKSVARLIEEGSGNGAKRLAAAGRLMAADLQKATQQQAFTAATGGAIIPREGGRFEVAGDLYTEQELIAAANAMSKAAGTAAAAYVAATKQFLQAQKDLNVSTKTTAQATRIQTTSVDTSDLSAGVKADQAASSQRLEEINKTSAALSKQQNIRNTLLKEMEAATSETNAAARETDRQSDSVLYQIQLLREGVLPSLAEEAIARESIFDKARKFTQNAADTLSKGVDNKDVQQEILTALEEQLKVISNQEDAYAASQRTLRDNLGLLEQARIQSATKQVGIGARAGFINEAGAAYEEQISKGVSPEIAAGVAKATEQLTIAKTAADAYEQSINSIGDAFGEAMTTGVAGLISGTATAKEVFASFLQSVGQALSQAASQMIATYVAIGIAKIFAGLGGGGGADMSKSGITEGTLAPMRQYTDAAGNMAPNFAGFANGGVAKGGFRAFANGGVVSGPTLGLVGEGKYNEAIVPLPDGKSIPVQLGTGSARDLLGGAYNKQSTSPVLSMSFQTTKFGNNEYVDVAQLQAAMAETRKMAAREGAAQGSQLALNRLKNSPGTRRQIGLR